MARRGRAHDEDTEEHIVEYLCVQNADHAILSDGVPTLRGIHASTLYFSDRPDRITGHVTTEEFVAHWDAGDDSFEHDPPNATLSVLAKDQPEGIVVVLKKPSLQDSDLVYEVDIQEGPDTIDGGPCSLFIDTVGNPLSPGSVAGVHRRHRRRRRRRIAH
jgi:hypothetical protein